MSLGVIMLTVNWFFNSFVNYESISIVENPVPYLPNYFKLKDFRYHVIF